MLDIMRGAAPIGRSHQMFDPDLSMDEIMRRWPATIPIIMKHGMLCVGCPIGPFHTISEACGAHGLDEATVTTKLLGVIRAAQAGATCVGDSRQ
jgi:hybrid cluster-associated redox disulfide protein